MIDQLIIEKEAVGLRWMYPTQECMWTGEMFTWLRADVRARKSYPSMQ